MAIAGALYAVLHPRMYKAGIEFIWSVMEGKFPVQCLNETAKALQFWSSPFNVVSLIVNRDTPVHRDSAGPACGLDLLLTGGSYNDGIFDTPSLGRRWMYNSGTGIAIMGKMLPHKVDKVNGERFCLAMYWREQLFKEPLPRSPYISDIMNGLCIVSPSVHNQSSDGQGKRKRESTPASSEGEETGEETSDETGDETGGELENVESENGGGMDRIMTLNKMVLD